MAVPERRLVETHRRSYTRRGGLVVAIGRPGRAHVEIGMR